MSTDVIWQTSCTDLKQSLALAECLGTCLKGGEVIELVSDVGGGKTTFVGGLARGMGSGDHVSSPTFTISNVYAADNLVMHHFDFYRLFEPGIMREELAEVIDDPKAVTVIEWANIVTDVLPDSKLTIRISASGETSREYEFMATSDLAYLIEGVSAC